MDEKGKPALGRCDTERTLMHKRARSPILATGRSPILATGRSLILAIGVACLWLAFPAMANATDLAGDWRGSGTVTFKSGASEPARCRATFRPSGKSAYDVSASCSSQSGTVTQQAFVRGTGNRFRGTFHNPEFDAKGTIQITVNGRSSQVARLNSNQGSAIIRLSRGR